MNEPVAAAAVSVDWMSMFTAGSAVGMSVLILLAILSVITWAVIVERWVALGNLQARSEDFLRLFWEAKSLSELNNKTKDSTFSPAREIFRSGYNEMVRVMQAREKKGATGPVPFETVRRSLGKARMVEEATLARNMSFLAIASSACPFIGLFGTVIGVIEAFQDIGISGSSSLAAVAPGISHALIATALGLAAAIPSVVFYNVFMSRARKHLVLLDGFSADFLNILERHFGMTQDGHS